MITKYHIFDYGDGDVYCGVTADAGEKQEWGPYESKAAAMEILRDMVQNVCDEERDEAKLEVRDAPDA